jgi:hypothetical protein
LRHNPREGRKFQPAAGKFALLGTFGIRIGVLKKRVSLLIALLKKIPTSGEWPAAQRVRWFKTFAMNVSQIYDVDAKQPVEMKIELEGDDPHLK